MVDLSALLSNLSESTLHLCQMPLPATPPAQKPVRELQRQIRLNTDQLQQLIAQHEAGRSVRQLTAEFGINRETVLEHLKRAGVPRRPHVRKLTDHQVQEAGQLYATNLSLVDVAKHFDVNATTLRREFTLAGVPTRPRRGWPDR